MLPNRYGYERMAGDSVNDTILSLFHERRDHSGTAHSSFHRALPAIYSLFRGDMRLRAPSHRNNVHIPLVYSVCMADTARKMDTIFGNYPYVHFIGNGPEDWLVARKQEALVHAEWKNMRVVRKFHDVFLGGSLYGKSIIEHGWKRKVGKRWVVDVSTAPFSGKTYRKGHAVDRVEYDGMDIKVHDLLNCFPQPGIADIHDMQWFIVDDEYMDITEVEQMAAEGTFDKKEVARMKQEGGGADESEDYYKQMRWTRFMFPSQSEALEKEPFSAPVRIARMYGFVPPEFSSDGITDRFVTIANGRYVLQNVPNPHWHGQIPLMEYSPSPDLHHFFPLGKGEMSAKIQIAANRFTNQQLDALDAYIYPSFIYNELSGLDPDDQYMAPGRLYPVQGDTTNVLFPVQPNLQGIEFGTAKTQELWRWMQQATGIADDLVMGVSPGGRETARGVLARQEAVGSRLLIESRMAETMVIEPLAEITMAYNQQYLDTPREVFMIGSAAVKDPVTGKPIQSRQQIGDFDLLPRYVASAMGSVSRLSAGQRQQNLLLAMQSASSNPVVAGAVNWLNFFNTLFRELEIENYPELINNQEDYQRMQQIAAGAQGTPLAKLGGQDAPGAEQGGWGLQAALQGAAA